VKRADFIWNWQRSRLKNPDKLNIFIKKNIRNHSYYRFYPVLVKIWFNRIWINRGLLYSFSFHNFFSIGYGCGSNSPSSAGFTPRWDQARSETPPGPWSTSKPFFYGPKPAELALPFSPGTFAYVVQIIDKAIFEAIDKRGTRSQNC